jgi:glycogen operon protein
VKNFLTVTMLSLGLPMIVMGDEVRRTQNGNNNGYCHDDESTWFDWTLVKTHADVHRFVKLLIARRLLRDVEHEQQRVSLTQLIQNANKSWHGVKLGKPDWGDTSLSVAFHAEVRREKLVFHLILNGYCKALDFELPPTAAGNRWRRWIDTSLPSPQDIVDWRSAPPVPEGSYLAGPRSVVMLYAGNT